MASASCTDILLAKSSLIGIYSHSLWVEPQNKAHIMRKRPAAKKKPQERVIPIIWNFPEDLISGYATNIVVQNGEQELYVSFFEAQPPILLAPEDAEKLESVNAECIARIVITPDRMAKFIDVLQKQLNVFNSKKAAEKSSGSK
jgi:hypothetical protein